MAEMQFDRRRYKRFTLPCPATLLDSDQTPASARTLNISDGGALLALPLKDLPEAGRKLKVKLSLPRSTASTHMVEKVRCEGLIKRHQPLTDDRYAAVAVEFVEPVNLQIEV
ncbi:MAG: PilZ domain-containing protein [Phycisphaerae bacterium]